MQIKDIMTKNVISVNKDTSLSEAADLLFNNQLSGLPVVENQQVVGIVTEGDLITNYDHLHIPSYIKFLKCLTDGRQCPLKFQNDYKKMIQLKVEAVMNKQVMTVNQEAQINEAVEIFRQHRINPLPVVDQDNKICGIISRSDIIKLFTGAVSFQTPFSKQIKIKTLGNDICRAFASVLQCQQAILFLSGRHNYKIFGYYGLNKNIYQIRGPNLNSPFSLTIKKSSDWLITKENIVANLSEFNVPSAVKNSKQAPVDYIIPLWVKKKFIGFLILSNSLNQSNNFDQALVKHLIQQAGIYLNQTLLKQQLQHDRNELAQAQQIKNYLLAHLTNGAILINYYQESIIYLNKLMLEILPIKNYHPLYHKIDTIIKERPNEDFSIFLSFYKERKSQRRSLQKSLFVNQEFSIGSKKLILNSIFIWGANKQKKGDFILIEPGSKQTKQ